jgi:hypothetical protein
MKNLIIIISFIFLTGCSKPVVQQYAGNHPQFDIYEYFLGKTTGWGIVQDRSGTLTRQFVVHIDGSLDSENRLVLDESFEWSDGEKSSRIWVISKDSNGFYSGTAGDVVGTATGESAGNALNWNYQLIVEVDGRKWKINMDDWMFLHRDNILINKTAMSKFGFHLGDITISFSKHDREE